jgi:hypothetical protein
MARNHIFEDSTLEKSGAIVRSCVHQPRKVEKYVKRLEIMFVFMIPIICPSISNCACHIGVEDVFGIVFHSEFQSEFPYLALLLFD